RRDLVGSQAAHRRRQRSRRARLHGPMTGLGSVFSSLRGRIFLASGLLAVLSIGVALYLVNVRLTREAEQTLQHEIVATGALVDQLRTTRTQTFTQMARFIADAPKVKA